MADYRFVQDGDEYYLEDADNPGVLVGGPVSGDVTVNNPFTGTTMRNYKTPEELAEETD